jgi:hypothetical protein
MDVRGEIWQEDGDMFVTGCDIRIESGKVLSVFHTDVPVPDGDDYEIRQGDAVFP